MSGMFDISELNQFCIIVWHHGNHKVMEKSWNFIAWSLYEPRISNGILCTASTGPYFSILEISKLEL